MKNNFNQETLFDRERVDMSPLADRMRPNSISEFVGQEHIVAEGALLRRAIKLDAVGSCIFWGPPGTGKTTLANIIANSTGAKFVKLNAVSSGVADAKQIIEQAAADRKYKQIKTYLLLDECHRWSKAQSDCVLQAIEQGTIIFIGSTTENPYVSMTAAIVSRCRVFEFKRLSESDIKGEIVKALNSPKGFSHINIQIDDEALNTIARVSGGDLRNAYNILELAALTTNPDENQIVKITQKIAAESSQSKPLSVNTDTYYDMISAFCKSLRGSDENAALFWFMRLISAGCDPMLLVRRLIVHSCEDVGLADHNALLMATAALDALKNIGMPEARIPIACAIIYVCRAPKSNSVITALDLATADVEKYADCTVPYDLMDVNYQHTDDDKKHNYLYPHDYGGFVSQQYLPNEAANHIYYSPSNNGEEKNKSFKQLFIDNKNK
ncbi:MAG: replication-associated recombination protein A [Clostridia bacterium]